MPNAELYIR